MIDSLITVTHYVMQLTNVVNILHDTFTNYANILHDRNILHDILTDHINVLHDTLSNINRYIESITSAENGCNCN